MIVTCACGKRMRVGEDAIGKRVKCPGCHEWLHVEDEAAAGDQITEAPPSRAAREAAPARRPMLPPDEEDADEEPPFPGSVRAAGVIWIVAGALILLSGAALLVLTLATTAGSSAAGGYLVGSGCGAAFVALFGGAFIHVGVQSVSGTAKDTLGNGVGSLVFGLLQWGLVAATIALNQGATPLLFLQAGLGFGYGAALLAAGVLALAGRGAYKEWRRWKVWRDPGPRRRWRR